MSYDEQMHLFGAPPGELQRISVELCRPEHGGPWVTRLTAEATMRQHPWRVNVHTIDGNEAAKHFSEFADIAMKSVYQRSETIRLHMIRIAKRYMREGEDCDVQYGGRHSLSL